MEQLDIVREEAQDETDNLFVPDINSSDKEERKLARRIRIEKRVEALARQLKAAAAGPEKEKERCSLLQIQLEKSSEILRVLFNEAEQAVTNVRVANDSREVDRREKDVLGRERILAMLRADAASSMAAFEDIADRWPTMTSDDKNDPLHICEQLDAQRTRCMALVRQKDAVIASLRTEIRNAEARFYVDQHAQNDDIRMLAQRVEKQVTMMRAAHAVELQHIEDVMIQERANMMENNDRRWDEMYKRREELELAIAANKLVQRAEFEDVLGSERTKHYERVREVKISLERDCDLLQHEFEHVKASALTNSEKMDYNYQILKKREAENIIIKSNQKRLLNRLQDTVDDLRRKIRAYEADADAQLRRLYADIVALQKCIQNERQKGRAVSTANDRRYAEIWELNRAQATQLLHKILTIDKLLCEQQLGVEWSEPHVKLLVKEKLPSYRAAVKMLELQRGRRVKDTTSPSMIAAAMAATPEAAQRRCLRHVLERVADHSGFLVEERLMRIITGHTSAAESALVRVDSVFEALGIVSADDVRIMMHFFRPYVRCEICTEANEPATATASAPGTPADTASVTMSVVSSRASAPMTMTTASTETGAAGVMMTTTATPSGGADDVANELDAIVAAVLDVDYADEDDESVQPTAVVKEGECLGPPRIVAEQDKRVTQVADKVQIIGDEEGGRNCLLDHPLYMNPASVLRALREFVTNVMCKHKDTDARTSDAELVKTTMTVSRMMSQREVKEYWERYKAMIAEQTSELWKALFYGMKKYHAILEDRHKVNEELNCLLRQNAELRTLLEEFEGDEELTHRRPPCAVERRTLDVQPVAKFADCGARRRRK